MRISNARRLGWPRTVAIAALGFGIAAVSASPAANAQAPARGQNVVPVYEGFWPQEDGTYDLWFGYYNRNWEEELNVPVGPGNHLDPEGPDLGQPTHFFPRRSQFVFKVNVPADFGDNEVVWTLTSKGKTEQAYATLRPEYMVNETVMMANFGAGGITGFHPDMIDNAAPTLTIDGETKLRARVGEPLTLSAVVEDDGKFRPRPMPAALAGASHFVPNSATGLRLSWFRYRGPGEVEFDPPQTKVWQDRRDGGNSPWSAGWSPPPVPDGNRWAATATFSEPGTYVLRALTSDGGLIDYDDVTIDVNP